MPFKGITGLVLDNAIQAESFLKDRIIGGNPKIKVALKFDFIQN
jgi:hypothetical protein